jgi:cytosine/adenosine deaminase-related metal-dependent hydrolase
MIITCSKLVTGRSDDSPIECGAVVINKGIIQAVGSSKYITRRFPGHRTTCLQNAVLMPGLINAHTHLELPSLLDHGRSQTFPDWILNLIQDTRSLRRQDFRSAAAENIGMLIQSGTTTVGEICTHGVSQALLRRNGLRAVVFNEIIGMGKFDVPLPSRSDSMLIGVGLSPHSPYTVSEQALRAISVLSRKHKIRLAMHIAESVDEIRLLQRKKSGLERIYQFAKWDLDSAPKGLTSFEYLRRIGFLSSSLLAVHAVQVTDHDIAMIRKANVSIAHCPRSNKVIRVGRMPLKKILEAGIPVGLGTDSLASSPSLNMWDEMRFALQIHKQDGIKDEDVVRLATIGGARALGLDDDIGTLERGKKADLIAVPLPQKNTGNLYSDLLRETKSCIMTMVNGKMLHRK